MGKLRKKATTLKSKSPRIAGVSEWMWLLVESSDNEQRLVFGRLDNEPIANSDMELDQRLAVSYDKVRDHRRFA
jgi:hypothetical protein